MWADVTSSVEWQINLCVCVCARVCEKASKPIIYPSESERFGSSCSLKRVPTQRYKYSAVCIKTCLYLFTTEPTSSTQAEACAGSGQEVEQDEREVPCGSQEEGSDMDQTEQQAPAGVLESPETSRDSEESNSDPVSSSSSSSGSSCSIEESAEAAREDIALTPSSSTTEAPTEGAMDSATLNTGTTEEPMEQD